MTEDQLQAIEVRAHQAGRPWSSEPWIEYLTRTLPQMEVLARDDVPALLAEVRRLNAELDSAQQALEWVVEDERNGQTLRASTASKAVQVLAALEGEGV